MADDEHKLIEQCLAGRTRAFAVLVRRYQDRIYNTVFRMIGQAEDAQDIVQETFLKAYDGLGRFRANASFYTWLYRIAVNACLTERRKRQRRPGLVSMDSQRTRTEPAADADQTRPSRPVESAECRQAVRQAIQALPAEQRAAVVLKDIEGHSYESIADILQCPVGTVRSRLHRARMQLRESLAVWI